MNTKEIIESGFFVSFISEYLEYYTYTADNDKQRLLYALCDTDIEKQIVTKLEIEKIKNRIQELGNENLSFAFILSCDPQCRDYINDFDIRMKFWATHFAEDFSNGIISLSIISDGFMEFYSKHKAEFAENETDYEDVQSEFWSIYKNWKPKKAEDADVGYIMDKEYELIDLIESDIEKYKETEWWEFDWDEYRLYIEVSKPIEILFDYCELLYCLCSLNELKSAYLHDKSADEFQSPTANDNTDSAAFIANLNIAAKKELDMQYKYTMKDKFEINVDEFFDSIRDSSITKIEIYNTIEILTDNFEVEKLKILLDDFEFFLFEESEAKSSEYTIDEIIKEVEVLKDKGKAVPYFPDIEFVKDENGKLNVINKGDSKIIDKEKLLYPYEFFWCYQFIAMLKGLIKKHDINSRKTISEPTGPPQQKELPLDPLWYLDEAKQTFYYNLTSNGLSKERADEIFHFITNLINQLKEIRKVEAQTRDTIVKATERFLGNNPFNDHRVYIEEWLLKAIANNDTYFHAYNYLIQSQNRVMHTNLARKIMSDFELFRLIKLDEEQSNKENSPSADHQSTQTNTVQPKPEPENKAEKISRILKESLKGAFTDPTHIDTIIEGFIAFLPKNEPPKNTAKAVVRIDMKDFIKPFRQLQDDNILKREQISQLLNYFIEKNTMNDSAYSQKYLNKLLSKCKPN